MEVSCTGILQSQEKKISLSYVVGKLSFIDTPKIFNKGSNVQGKVSIQCLVSVYTWYDWGKYISMINLCASNRLKQFIIMIHQSQTCHCTCLRGKCGHHIFYRISRLTEMVLPLSHLARLIITETSTSM